jgi:cytidyltransferase-like protein
MRKFVCILSLLLAFELSASPKNQPVRVYVDMIADLFHCGHVEFFKKALEYGDELIVGLVSDEEATSYKRQPILTLEERVSSVSGCRYVTEVVPNCPMAVDEAFIKEHKIDVVVHGDDFDKESMRKYYRVPLKMGIFQTVPYSKGISTTEILRRIKERMEKKTV